MPHTPTDEDLAIWRTAKALIDKLGPDALDVAREVAHEQAVLDNEEAAVAWDKTRQAVEWLLEKPELARLFEESRAIPDRDVWAAATVYIRQHGEDASVHAAMMADQFADKGDDAGKRLWLKIIDAIKWLQDNRGRDPFKVEH